MEAREKERELAELESMKYARILKRFKMIFFIRVIIIFFKMGLVKSVIF